MSFGLVHAGVQAQSRGNKEESGGKSSSPVEIDDGGGCKAMNNFYLRPEIIYGDQGLDYLEQIKGKKIMIFTDQPMIKLGIVRKIEKIIERRKIPYHIFSGVEPDPSMDVVKKGLARFTKSKPDILIAIGGGSVIDTAKAVLFFSMKIQKQFVDEKSVYKPMFIAIPTTSGTGSEVTSYSVVTDQANAVKVPLRDRMMIPDVAILDEELTQSVPPKVTADTGMDVLTHALEAFVSNKSSVFTDMLAEKAIRLVFTYLPPAVHNGKDMLARRNLHLASCMAGIAFENASLGINHSLAHSVGAKYHLSHGRSNAILLPYVIAYNAGIYDGTANHSKAAQKYAEAAAWLGLSAESAEQGVKNLIEAIKKLNQKLSLPVSIHATFIDRNIFEKNLPQITKVAIKDICTEGNPRKVSEKDLANILRRAY